MPVGGEDDTIANEPTSERSAAVDPGAGNESRPLHLRAGALDEAELVAGRYRVMRWLGAGGMGRVYEALDTELDERVALKVLRSGLSDEAIERFRREVKLTRRIQHRNVARMSLLLAGLPQEVADPGPQRLDQERALGDFGGE